MPATEEEGNSTERREGFRRSENARGGNALQSRPPRRHDTRYSLSVEAEGRREARVVSRMEVLGGGGGGEPQTKQRLAVIQATGFDRSRDTSSSVGVQRRHLSNRRQESHTKRTCAIISRKNLHRKKILWADMQINLYCGYTQISFLAARGNNWRLKA